MKLEQARILEHRDFRGGYRLLVFDCPAIAKAVKPGQFVHLRVPGLDGSVLRRPFSVYRAEAGRFSILYKQVGRGTNEMALLPAGREVSIIGPLGNGFPLPPPDTLPVLVAGGYGVAPLYLLALRMARTGLLFVGGRTADDILCTDDFRELGWDVRVTTEDGSLGERGRVTDAALDPWIAHEAGEAHAKPFGVNRLGAASPSSCGNNGGFLDGGRTCGEPRKGFASASGDVSPVFYACGPDGLLRAVDTRVLAGGWQGWLSLDKHMGCGVGACLACVQRVRVADGQSQWKRVCKDGPVFAAGEIFWDYGIKTDNA